MKFKKILAIGLPVALVVSSMAGVSVALVSCSKNQESKHVDLKQFNDAIGKINANFKDNFISKDSFNKSMKNKDEVNSFISQILSDSGQDFAKSVYSIVGGDNSITIKPKSSIIYVGDKVGNVLVNSNGEIVISGIVWTTATVALNFVQGYSHPENDFPFHCNNSDVSAGTGGKNPIITVAQEPLTLNITSDVASDGFFGIKFDQFNAEKIKHVFGFENDKLTNAQISFELKSEVGASQWTMEGNNISNNILHNKVAITNAENVNVRLIAKSTSNNDEVPLFVANLIFHFALANKKEAFSPSELQFKSNAFDSQKDAFKHSDSQDGSSSHQTTGTITSDHAKNTFTINIASFGDHYLVLDMDVLNKLATNSVFESSSGLVSLFSQTGLPSDLGKTSLSWSIAESSMNDFKQVSGSQTQFVSKNKPTAIVSNGPLKVNLKCVIISENYQDVPVNITLTINLS